MVKIFVGGVSPSASPEELKKLFERYGQVNECDILKNYAFVHMEREQDAHRAIGELHKQEFYGSHLTVEYATSKIRNATKIYVGNVSSRATTSQIKELFEKFGKVVECDIVKNYAFVHMAKEREAMDAILHLNDTPLEDQKIFVTLSKSNNAPKSSKLASSAVIAVPTAPPPPPPPPPAYYFHRGRLPPPPASFSAFSPRCWYEREYYERYTYDIYDRSGLGARAAYDRALAPVVAAAAATLPTAPVAAAPTAPTSISAALAPAAYRDRSPVGRRTAAAVMAQYADPYGASQAYSQSYSQAYASAFSQYSLGAAGYSPAEYYEKYANGQIVKTFNPLTPQNHG
ncbi:PREDICTED: RNA-binding protein 4B-like [Nanorana parkeri]|uniref:RNA-binding protein 4B-like n=1 Tax=Nanorana parkeri TaxID=125878 RepID=UPI000853F211|nr:PREDICTED: RNA-binding protein 4B-like [Nanorana parkeri]